MDIFRDLCNSGEFLLSDGLTVPGEINLNGDATRIKLFTNTRTDWSEKRDILGRLHDSTKISLLKCIPMAGTGEYFRGSEHFHIWNLFPHFVLIGHEQITSTEERVARIQFSIDDATILFGDMRTFGQIHNAREHLESLSKDVDSIDIKAIGSNPQLFYFNGNQEIISVDTTLGQFSAWYGLTNHMPGASGIRVEAEVVLSLQFPKSHTFDKAIQALLDLVRFIELAAGRPQHVRKVKIELDGDGDVWGRLLDVYWSLAPQRNVDSELEAPDSFDLPLRPSQEPDQFKNVLANWLTRNDDWRDARLRFEASFAYQRRYGTDRLVCAANMFDLLPDTTFSDVQAAVPVELAEARDKARELFRKLPSSDDKNSILGALGRVGKLSLKKKVSSRVSVIVSRLGDLFPDLDFVTDHAIECRNYFVHGTKPKLDYKSGSNPVSFFTDTLEFVFAVSDLIDAGWNAHSCLRRYTTMSHPFGRYRANYADDLAQLKALKKLG